MQNEVDCLVIFEHRHAAGPMRLLRPGFRHCFCVLANGSDWLICDPLKGSLVLELVRLRDAFDITRHFVDTGRHVLVGAKPSPPPTTLRIRPLTCVEIVKRLIGIDAPCIFTPYQLFRHLLHRDKTGCRFRYLRGSAESMRGMLDSAN
jgi:hypothetical protein